MIYENQEKLDRANEIVAFLTGKKAPLTEGEHERKQRFGVFLSEAKIDPKSAEAVKFIYEKLGGRVITEEEKEKIEIKKKEISKKRKMVE